MEASLLQSQISQRTGNVSRIANMINERTGDFMEGWKEKTGEDFQKRLETYSTALNEKVSKEVADKGEGISFLTNVPQFYQVGEAGYKVAPTIIQKGLDKTGSFVQSKAGKIVEKAEALKTSITNKVSDYLQGTTPTDNVAIQSGDPENPLEGISRPTANPVVSSTETALDDTLVADTGLAETGVGSVVAGVIAGGVGLALGLEHLLGHHHKDPKQPVLPSAPPVLQNKYSIGSSVLPNVSSVISGNTGTMAF